MQRNPPGFPSNVSEKDKEDLIVRLTRALEIQNAKVAALQKNKSIGIVFINIFLL